MPAIPNEPLVSKEVQLAKVAESYVNNPHFWGTLQIDFKGGKVDLFRIAQTVKPVR
jgi:hypothetical protein